mgnify:CR=1 FL=1
MSQNEYYKFSPEKCLALVSSKMDGLTYADVQARLAKSKELQIEKAKKSNLFIKFLGQLKELMVLILLISAVVSIVIGITKNSPSEIVDGGIILGIVVMNAIFGVVQEFKTEKAIESLKKMTESTANVLRDGKVERIKSTDLVFGDIVLLEAGTIVPADLRLTESVNLKINESALTGESDAVIKSAKAQYSTDTPIGDRKNIAYFGSVVENGRGKGVVVALGKQTEFGKIAESLKDTKKELTPLQKNIQSVGKVLTYLILLIASVTFVLEAVARPDEILNAFLTSVAISVAAIPESMPAVITIIMSLGIAELSKQKAIVKKMHAVEALGCCDVICSDKTGTITENRMTVDEVWTNFDAQCGHFELLLKNMVLNNDGYLGKNGYVGDSTEVALLNYARTKGVRKENETSPRLNEIPFSSQRKMMSTLNLVGGKKVVFVKGAIDRILQKCTKIATQNGEIELSKEKRKEVLAVNSKMCKNALRVLAFAFKFDDDLTEENLTFLGMVGMIDPPRKEIFDAVKKCRRAGMRPVMITGDYKDTAFAIAKKIGVARSMQEVLSGEDIDKFSAEEFSKVVEKVSVFARVSPEHKKKIVEALKSNGHNVAMTGDGVNDAPSMKKANIGIGMGRSGTDVTKEVADIIITDDNFATIVVAVEEGRKIYSNIQKTIKFLFSANMAEILALFFVTIIFPNKTFLLPVQILFINLITDSLPAIALGLEKVESGVMEENPRDTKSGLFSNGVGVSIAVLGAIQTLLTLSAYVIGLYYYNEYVGMTMAFYTLNFIQLFYMFTARTKESCFKSNPFKNKFFTLSLVVGFGLLTLIATTSLGEILKLTSLDFSCWAVVFIFSISIIFIGELYKVIERKLLTKFTKKRRD